ncbi:unnamed protein product [Miscanthus lutarioriparius]|uniref:Uncharacterized protein n=1 Tax=Miscanthus lutarioriparius TaxID=422564 RepID=A0A811SAT3_9POAL|nr:unnamed protein product [Miscanthus lutarioriparius]
MDFSLIRESDIMQSPSKIVGASASTTNPAVYGLPRVLDPANMKSTLRCRIPEETFEKLHFCWLFLWAANLRSRQKLSYRGCVHWCQSFTSTAPIWQQHLFLLWHADSSPCIAKLTPPSLRSIQTGRLGGGEEDRELVFIGSDVRSPAFSCASLGRWSGRSNCLYYGYYDPPLVLHGLGDDADAAWDPNNDPDDLVFKRNWYIQLQPFWVYPSMLYR